MNKKDKEKELTSYLLELDTQNNKLEKENLINRSKGYNYLYNIIYKDSSIKFDDIDKLNEEQIRGLATENNNHLSGLINEKGCKYVLLKIQETVLNINKKVVDKIKLLVNEEYTKSDKKDIYDNKLTEALKEQFLIKRIDDFRNIILQEPIFKMFDKSVINYDKDKYNSLLIINLNGDCKNLNKYIMYICQFINVVLNNLNLLNHKSMAISRTLKNNDSNCRDVVYFISKLNDKLDKTEKLI